MIFFSRLGFLLLPIFAATGLFVGRVIVGLMGSTDEGLSIVVAGLIAAGLTWFAGSKLNDPTKGRVVDFAKAGAAVRLKRRHTLIFIPLQYYAVLFLLVGGLGIFGSMSNPERVNRKRSTSSRFKHCGIFRRNF